MSHQATTASEIKVLIDGQETRVKPETTILRAARTLGISIPTLCHHPAVEPYGACRVCTVELKRGKRSRMVTACNYPLREEGLEILTQSERALRARRLVLELLMARCPEVKVIRDMAREAGLEKSRYPQGDTKERCILCGLCVNICNQVVGANAIGFISRGPDRKVGTPFLENSKDCIGCGACAFACPTQCISMTEKDGVRKIWDREFKLAVCPVCGNYYAPIEQLETIRKQVNLSPDHFKVCFTCRGLKL